VECRSRGTGLKHHSTNEGAMKKQSKHHRRAAGRSVADGGRSNSGTDRARRTRPVR